MAIYSIPQEFLREPNLLIPGKKPAGQVKVDLTNPLSRELESLWLMNDIVLVRDVVSRSTITNSASSNTYTSRGNSFGKHVHVSGSDNAGYVTDTYPTAEMTVLFIWTPDAAPSESHGSILGFNLDIFANWDHGNSDFQRTIVAYDGGSWTKTQWDQSGNERAIISFTHSAESTLNLYKNGRFVTSAASVTVSTSNPLNILPGSTGGYSAAEGILESVFKFTRILTVSEIYDLSSDPYQLLIPV